MKYIGERKTGLESSEGEKHTYPKSQALVAQVILQETFENNPKSPSKERLRACFDALDVLTQNIGTYSTLLALVIEELKKSVYSTGVTSSKKPPYFESIPFCDLVERINSNRSQEEQCYKAELLELQQKLKFREHDLYIVNRQNIFLKSKLEEFQSIEKGLRYEIQDLKILVDGKEADKELNDVEQALKEEKLQKQIEELNAANIQANAVIEKLTMLKSSPNPTLDGKKGMLQYDLAQSLAVKTQFSEILDFLLDEYEQNLGQLHRKKDIMKNAFGDPESVDTFKNVEDDYRRKIEKYLLELKFLEHHVDALKLQNKKLQMNTKLPTLDPVSDCSFRKYSIIMDASHDGKQFECHSDCKFCAKCGEKVISCYHDGTFTKIIKLPESHSFIKFRNPCLKLKSQVKSRAEEKTDENSLNEDENPLVSAFFYKIWKDFYEKRNGKREKHNRPYTLDKLLHLIEEIYEYKWNEENLANIPGSELVKYEKFADSFYEKMKSIYIFEKIYGKTFHDFLTALQLYEKTNLHVYIFAMSLSGEVEEIWKYAYLVKKLITYDEQSINLTVYRQKVRLLYPDRPNDIYEYMELEFISYCENKIEQNSMIDYTFQMIKKNAEPNIVYFLKMLDKWNSESAGTLSLAEFQDFCSQLLPLTSEEEIERRFRVIENDYNHSRIPIERLAYLAAYLLLFNLYSANWKLRSQISPRYADFKTDTGDKMNMELSIESN